MQNHFVQRNIMFPIPLAEPSTLHLPASNEGADGASHTVTKRLSSSNSAIESSIDESYQKNIVNSDATRDRIASDLLKKLETGCHIVMEDIADTSPDAWEIMIERQNYVAKRKTNSTFVHLKVESELPYHILDVFNSLVNPQRWKANPNIQSVEVMKTFSTHTWLTFTVYKPVSKFVGSLIRFRTDHSHRMYLLYFVFCVLYRMFVVIVVAYKCSRVFDCGTLEITRRWSYLDCRNDE